MVRIQIRFTSQNYNDIATQISKRDIYNRSVICNIKNGENDAWNISYVYTGEF